MKIAFKMFIRNIHRYLFWAVISVVVWAWIFSLATDTVRAKKVVVYCDAPFVSERELMIELEKDLPEGIRLVKVSSFESLEFGMYTEDADIYVIPGSSLADAADKLAPLPFEGAEGYTSGGKLLAAKLGGGAGSFISGEDLYICVSAASPHSGLEGAKDSAAVYIVGKILSLP